MAAPTCTTCKDQPLEWHCQTCEWWTCPDCCATYDVERGVKVNKRGEVEAL